MAAAKAQHSALYGQIALSHAQVFKLALKKGAGKDDLLINFNTFICISQGVVHPIVPAVVPQVGRIGDYHYRLHHHITDALSLTLSL